MNSRIFLALLFTSAAISFSHCCHEEMKTFEYVNGTVDFTGNGGISISGPDGITIHVTEGQKFNLQVILPDIHPKTWNGVLKQTGTWSWVFSSSSSDVLERVYSDDNSYFNDYKNHGTYLTRETYLAKKTGKTTLWWKGDLHRTCFDFFGHDIMVDYGWTVIVHSKEEKTAHATPYIEEQNIAKTMSNASVLSAVNGIEYQQNRVQVNNAVIKTFAETDLHHIHATVGQTFRLQHTGQWSFAMPKNTKTVTLENVSRYIDKGKINTIATYRAIIPGHETLIWQPILTPWWQNLFHKLSPAYRVSF